MKHTRRNRLFVRARLQLAVGLGALALLAVAYGAIHSTDLILPAAGAAAAVVAYLGLLGARLVAEVETTRGAILATGADGILPPLHGDAHALAEISELRDTIARRLAQYANGGLDARLAEIIAVLPDGVLVSTPDGLVSAANFAGRRALGIESGVVGTSVFNRLSRSSVAESLARARTLARPIRASIATVDGGTLPAVVTALKGEAGAVFVFRALPGDPSDHRAEIEVDLTLHEKPPACAGPTKETPLEELPLVSLDTETTGLNVTRDRIVAVGSVRLHGRQLFRSCTFDTLVRPGRSIPVSATAIHRITNAMVAHAPEIGDVWPRLRECLLGAVVLGHHIAFDLAMLSAAASRHRLPWAEPLALDTARLAAALDPSEGDLDLAAIACRHGITPLGRHTALGDSLMTAELYLRMLPRLLDRGVLTLGDAIRFSGSARVFAMPSRGGR